MVSWQWCETHILFFLSLVKVWEQSVENSNLSFCLASAPVPSLPISEFSPFPFSHPLDLSHSGCAHPAIFHCPFIPKFHSNIPMLCLSPHIHRYEYLLTAGCVNSPGPNHFWGIFFSTFFHFFYPPTSRPIAHTLRPVSFISGFFSN